MIRLGKITGGILVVTLFAIVSNRIILAQSSIINVPSTETQPEKTTYIEADLFTHFASYRNGGFQFFGPSMVYGLRKNVEIGANFYYGHEESKNTVEFQPNIKWRPYENQKSGTAVSVGAIGFIPLNESTGARPNAMIYANVSQTLQSAKAMKITGGIYQWVNTEQGFGTKTGAMLGLQQPITKKITILADWFSGKNRFGYASAGLGYEVSKSQYFGLAYSFGNLGRGNNYLTAFYGITL